MAATLKKNNVPFPWNSGSSRFVTSVVDSFRLNLASESSIFPSFSELKVMFRGQLARGMNGGQESKNANRNGDPEIVLTKSSLRALVRLRW
jgi:hypothetical protein